MKRRNILKYTAILTGATVGAPILGTLISGCQSDNSIRRDNNQLHFFTRDEFSLVKELVDLIIPKTDSPSASELNIHKVIDSMVGMVYSDENKLEYQKGFRSLKNYLEKESGKKGFLNLESRDKLNLLLNLDLRVDDQILNEEQQAFLNLKQQTIAYYLSTEEIGKNYLNYLPVPGNYEACISLEEVGGKAWTL